MMKINQTVINRLVDFRIAPDWDDTARLTRHQFKMLVALAKLGGTKIYSSEFKTVAEMPSSAAAAKALKRLVDDGLVYFFNREYRFFNPFLREWLLSKGY